MFLSSVAFWLVPFYQISFLGLKCLGHEDGRDNILLCMCKIISMTSINLWQIFTADMALIILSLTRSHVAGSSTSVASYSFFSPSMGLRYGDAGQSVGTSDASTCRHQISHAGLWLRSEIRKNNNQEYRTVIADVWVSLWGLPVFTYSSLYYPYLFTVHCPFKFLIYRIYRQLKM